MDALAASLLDQWSNPRWRLNNLYYITDKAGDTIPFRMNWAQEALFNDMHELCLILKCRQLGFTTFIQLFMLDACLFNSNVQAGTIAHTLTDAINIFSSKVRFPYDTLPEGLKAQRPAVEDSARSLSFPNGSRIRVGTSMRSGTLQYLHVSEYGKLCARFPEKAREVRTGALNTLASGQIGFIESTAEGQEGDFFERCQKAQEQLRRGVKLTQMDWKFFFFPWWKHAEYRLDVEVETPADMAEYFAKLKSFGIELDAAQKAWYVKKYADQGMDMKREYPSTPEEAFEAAIEGAYYGDLLAKAEVQGRICKLPVEDAITETWWDLGLNDAMAIWWVQRVGPWLHFIDYFEDSGEGLAYYAKLLSERRNERDLIYGKHLWPHDGRHRVMDEYARKKYEIMAGLGYEPEIVRRDPDVLTGIEGVRAMLPRCRFDAERCSKGLATLRAYRKEWKEDLGTWGRSPLHNWASNGADAFRTGASYEPSTFMVGPVKPDLPGIRRLERKKRELRLR